MSSTEPLDHFFSHIEKRLSNYAITNTSPIPDSRIQSIVEAAIKHAPSTFNVQSARAVILLRADHEKLWDIGDDEIKNTLPESAYSYLKPKIQGFRAGYGTVLWFEDQDALDTLKDKNQSIQHCINDCETWPFIPLTEFNGSLHSSGIHQFIVWTALQAQGLGCNLQHYNFMPNFSARVAREWNLPESWSLQAQLVFGTPVDGLKRSKPRQYLPLQDRVKLFGSS